MIDNTNVNIASISTDQAINDILDNFSEEYIKSIIQDSFNYKFRPYNTRMPNLPLTLHDKFIGIYDNYHGDSIDLIKSKELSIWQTIIDTICQYYNLKVMADIPDEQLYSMAYLLYQIFISEFTDRMINFFAYYIINNISSIVNSMNEQQKSIKTSYAKKLYTNESQNQNYILVYDNMTSVLDIIVTQDISLYQLIELLYDSNAASFITSYISDCGDIYKDYFASYIKNSLTQPDMISIIKLKLVTITANNSAIINNGGQNVNYFI